ncbi:MAG: sugar transferase [Lachnospiraceae bacterium]|nr:sugar transferase [Lachnospiraceae bacterium]
MYKKDESAGYKHFDFLLLDWICFLFSFLMSLCIRFHENAFLALFTSEDWMKPYMRVIVLITCVHILIVLLMEPYKEVLKRDAAVEFREVCKQNVCMLICVITFLFAEQSSIAYSRLVMFGWIIGNLVLMYIYHYGYKKYLQRSINRKEKQDNLLLVVPYEQMDSVLQQFYSSEISTLKIVGIVLANSKAELEAASTGEMIEGAASTEWKGSVVKNIPIVGNLNNPFEYARTHVVDEVLICMDGELAEQMAEMYTDMGIVAHVSIRNLVRLPKAVIGEVNGIPVVTSASNVISQRQIIMKRLIDICCGLLGSIVTIIVAILLVIPMMIADPGPIFFRQERVGRNGRKFRIWKFRTMYTDAEARKAELMAQNKMSGLMFKMDDDPRIIGYGKKFSLGEFLRKTSIDELPQSFNILAGSMSVVGTRPPTVKEYEQYDLHHKGRLSMKPGLTGMWQVSGRSDITDFEEVVRLDKEYIDNFSLLMDLRIMLKTVKVVLGKEGSV